MSREQGVLEYGGYSEYPRARVMFAERAAGRSRIRIVHIICNYPSGSFFILKFSVNIISEKYRVSTTSYLISHSSQPNERC